MASNLNYVDKVPSRRVMGRKLTKRFKMNKGWNNPALLYKHAMNSVDIIRTSCFGNERQLIEWK